MMYRTVIALSATLLMGVSGAALAQQAEHDAHRLRSGDCGAEPAPVSSSGCLRPPDAGGHMDVIGCVKKATP